MVKLIPTEEETNLVISKLWGIGTITSREIRNGTVVLKADFPNGWREFNFDYFHRKGTVSYAMAEDAIQKRSRQQECVEYLKSRNVKYLVHFTPIENLKYILSEGICPRTMQRHISAWTDEHRLDGHKDCSSLSVSFPNYSMLFRKRLIKGMDNFAILLIDCNALLNIDEDDVAYFQTNAAETRNQSAMLGDHTGICALESMFDENIICKEGIIKRIEQNVTSEFTTHPQAEILVRNIIPTQYIKNIVISNVSVKNDVVATVCGRAKVVCDENMFKPGSKWKEYQSRKKTNRYGYQTGFYVDGYSAVC